jgi:hypothetical protein
MAAVIFYLSCACVNQWPENTYSGNTKAQFTNLTNSVWNMSVTNGMTDNKILIYTWGRRVAIAAPIEDIKTWSKGQSRDWWQDPKWAPLSPSTGLMTLFWDNHRYRRVIAGVESHIIGRRHCGVEQCRVEGRTPQ